MLRWIIAVIALWATYQVRMQIPPFIAGGILAYLLSGPITALSRRAHLPRALAVLIVYVVVLGALGFGIYRLVPLIGDQSIALINHRHDIVENLVKQVDAAFGWNLDVVQITANILEKVQTFITEKPAELLEIGHYLTHSVFFLVVALVSSIYLVYEPQVVGGFLLRFVPEGKRQEVAKVAAEIDAKFSKYLIGQLLLVAIMSVLAYIILSLHHVRYALVIAVVTGILEIIPMLGPIMALALAAVIVISQLGVMAAAGIVGLLWMARLFEDYVVIPRVIGHAVQIHPVVTIFAVIAGETLGGALGMLLAVPVAAAFKVIIDHIYPQVAVAEAVNEPTFVERSRALAARLMAWKRQ